MFMNDGGLLVALRSDVLQSFFFDSEEIDGAALSQ